MNRTAILAIGFIILGVTASWGENIPSIEVSGRVYFSNDGTSVGGMRVTFFDLVDLRQSVSAITDEDGRFNLSLKPSSAAAPSIPRTFRLLQNFPNPFNPSTTIPYELQHPAQVRLEVFNMLGQRVNTLVDGMQSAGTHTVTWDARDGHGAGVAAGHYIYRITVGEVSDSRQMVLVDGPVSASTPSGGFPASRGFSAPAPSAQASHLYRMTIAGKEPGHRGTTPATDRHRVVPCRVPCSARFQTSAPSHSRPCLRSTPGAPSTPR